MICDGGCEFEFVCSGVDCFIEICVFFYEGFNLGDRVWRSVGNGYNIYLRMVGGKLFGNFICKIFN